MLATVDHFGKTGPPGGDLILHQGEALLDGAGLGLKAGLAPGLDDAGEVARENAGAETCGEQGKFDRHRRRGEDQDQTTTDRAAEKAEGDAQKYVTTAGRGDRALEFGEPVFVGGKVGLVRRRVRWRYR